MATREPPIELFYDPGDLIPGAPRLYVWRNDNEWELLDADGVLLSTHPSQGAAIEAARVRSHVRYCDILVRGSTGRVEWLLDQHPVWKPVRPGARRRARTFHWNNLRFHAGLRLIRTSKCLIPGREPPIELFYDPRELDPDTPRLHVGKSDGAWAVRDDGGARLSCHATLADAIDAAAERSNACFSEILVRDARGRQEWSYHHNPDRMDLIRLLVRTAPERREVAA